MTVKSFTFLTTIIFTCVTFTLNAQYHPFLESGKTWRELVDDAFGNWYIDEYQIETDTIINSVGYKKIEMVWSNDPNLNLPIYIGAAREDTVAKKVYIYYANDTTERLLYDFDLSVGDQHTFVNCHAVLFGFNPGNFIVDSIGIYIDANGLNRKVWYLNYSQNGITSRIVEGVGSNTGLFTYSCHFNYWKDLVCVHKDSAALFVNDMPLANYCTPYISVGLEKINSDDHEVSLYPNPSNNFIKIDFLNNTELSEVKVCVINQLGSTIPLNTKIENNGLFIDINQLKNGIYYLSIQTKKTNYTKRFVKVS